jgi:hypothetical protein
VAKKMRVEEPVCVLAGLLGPLAQSKALNAERRHLDVAKPQNALVASTVHEAVALIHDQAPFRERSTRVDGAPGINPNRFNWLDNGSLALGLDADVNGGPARAASRCAVRHCRVWHRDMVLDRTPIVIVAAESGRATRIDA